MTGKNYCLCTLLFVGILCFALQNINGQEILPVDSLLEKTTPAEADSTEVAVDTVAKPSNAVDAPVNYLAKDSMIMTLDGHNMVYLFGESSVKYKNLDLTGEYIEVDANDNIVSATFGLDSIGNEFGYPVFKEGETQYEMKKARYNFKTKKMYVTEVITQQGDGYITAGKTKKMPNDDLYMVNAKYTTCDDHEHPHFYLNLTKARIHPGKSVVTGPAYLVVEDVPLPIAVPFGFFPFTKDYSSGIIMPTYGDEMKRGFSLRNGGYYFALSDYIDLELTGEIYTKGSWGLNARSSYRKRYKFSGSYQANYLVTILGDKGDNDYSKTKDFRLTWTHSQDSKANPFSTFSASVNFSTSSYDRNDIGSIFSEHHTDNTKASSINYNFRPPNSPFSFNMTASISQVSQTQMLSLTLPSLTINMKDIYPFKRKEQIGESQWYEKILLRYTGSLTNSISAKENEILKKNVFRDWRNGMQHSITGSASFSLFKYITITPSIDYGERWYTNKINKEYNSSSHTAVPRDTIYGFYRIFNYSGSISASTKLYGMFKPWNLFGEWTKKTVIRHMFTPSISFRGAPDFGKKKYGYYTDLYYLNENTGRVDTLTYSPFEHQIWGVPGRGRSGSMSFSVDNNLEMKIPIAGTDSTRKITLIDNLSAGITYNFLADSMKWSNITSSIRFKFGKYTLSLNGTFDTYTYNAEGRRINITRWEAGKGLGRLMSTGTNFSYTLNNETLKNMSIFKKLFATEDDKKNSPVDKSSDLDDNSLEDNNIKDNESPTPSKRTSLRKQKKENGEYDSDGYLSVNIPWSLNFSYSWNIGYDTGKDKFNTNTREYPYKVTQGLGISGNISPTKGWSFNFNTNYDFEHKKFATIQCSISRQMHCWSMSASFIPVGVYQSYNFSIAVNSSMLKDLKYTQSSNFRDAMGWGD
jgi:hypothetical protein